MIARDAAARHPSAPHRTVTRNPIMLLRLRTPLALVFCMAVAACSSDEPPAAKTAAEPAKSTTPVSSASAHDPRSATEHKPRVVQEGKAIYEIEKRGEMSKPSATGAIECDQFAEKITRCYNSGAMDPKTAEDLRGEYTSALNAVRFKATDELTATCLDIQSKLQPKLIQAGCRNM
jgi:hypothetical protein